MVGSYLLWLNITAKAAGQDDGKIVRWCNKKRGKNWKNNLTLLLLCCVRLLFWCMWVHIQLKPFWSVHDVLHIVGNCHRTQYIRNDNTVKQISLVTWFRGFFKGAFFIQPFSSNEHNWIFRNLEFREKFLEFSRKIEFREKWLILGILVFSWRELKKLRFALIYGPFWSYLSQKIPKTLV